MKTSFFKNCRTLQEVKQQYKKLAMHYHPDRGGDEETMKQINQAYDGIISNPFFNFSGQKDEVKEDFIKFPEIINQIIGFNVKIEICGSWIWLSGNTVKYKEDLKRIGFRWSPNKIMWYWRPFGFRSVNKTPQTMEYIRNIYGSDLVRKEEEEKQEQLDEVPFVSMGEPEAETIPQGWGEWYVF